MIHDWGYSNTNGPNTWKKKYPAAGGPFQSPVNIIPSHVVPQDSLPKLIWAYRPEKSKTLVNTGNGWRVDVDSGGSELSGGPLEGKYVLEQFHCHWGDSNNQGSEHTVNGKAYPAELHLVHRNVTKYKSLAEAIEHPDGLCVLGIFIEPGKTNSELDKIVSQLSNVRFKNQKTKLDVPVNPGNFIPESSEYWSYEGSLTTPPCNECVIWIVFQNPIKASYEQLSMFRTSMSCCLQSFCNCENNQCNVRSNYRPTVPLGQRIVKQCVD